MRQSTESAFAIYDRNPCASRTESLHPSGYQKSSVPSCAEGGSQSVLKVLQSLAGCAVYGMLDGLSSNVSSGHNAKMYTAALGPSYMLYAIRMPHTYRYNPPSAGCCDSHQSCSTAAGDDEVSNLTHLLLITPCFCPGPDSVRRWTARMQSKTLTHMHAYCSILGCIRISRLCFEITIAIYKCMTKFT